MGKAKSHINGPLGVRGWERNYTHHEIVAAARTCHQEACDEELEYACRFNRLGETEKAEQRKWASN